MPTVITRSIGSGGGRDYATVAAWVAAMPADLVTADEQWIGEMYNDSEFTETIVTITKTTDATRNIILRAASGQSFADDADKLTNALFYSQANGVAWATVDQTLSVNSSYVSVSGLQLKSDSGTPFAQTAGGATVRLENLICQSGSSTSGSSACILLSGGVAVNCLSVNTNGGTGCISNGGDSEFRNVTSVQTGAATNFGFRGNYDSPLYLNCAAFGFGTNFRAGTSGSSDYNASGQASPPGANSVGSLTFADQFENVATDFRVKAGSDLEAAGTRDAANTADLDIVGSARSTTTPTIGAWEFGSAADTTAPVLSSPTGTATGSTTATVGATTDEANGTQYAFVSTSATPPSATDLKAGTGATWSGSITISSTGANTHSATGLTASTGYYAHLIHTDAAANDSNIVTSAQFTTDAANDPPVWSGTPSTMSSKRGQAYTPQDITSLVSDPELDTLAYSITGAPTGVTIDSSTGIISGTPTAAPGVYSCTVEADDGVNSPVSSSSFNITVTQCVLALSAAGYEFGDGNAPATMNILASTTLNAAVYPVAEWPPATAIATASGATNASGRLADLGDDDLVFGTSYRVIARNPSDGETWAWLMTAT